MQFVLARTWTFWWPVKVQVPSPDRAGEFEEQELEIRFEAVGQEEAKRLTEERAAMKSAQEREAHEDALLLRVVKDWRKVDGEDGKPVSFSAEAFRTALGFLPFRIGVTRAYAEAMAGAAREKN